MAIIKKTVSVEITTILGTQLTAADSSTSKDGTLALEAFKAMSTIVVDEGESMTEIPFHAIDHILVTETVTEEQAPADSTCVTAGN